MDSCLVGSDTYSSNDGYMATAVLLEATLCETRIKFSLCFFSSKLQVACLGVVIDQELLTTTVYGNG